MRCSTSLRRVLSPAAETREGGCPAATFRAYLHGHRRRQRAGIARSEGRGEDSIQIRCEGPDSCNGRFLADRRPALPRTVQWAFLNVFQTANAKSQTTTCFGAQTILRLPDHARIWHYGLDRGPIRAALKHHHCGDGLPPLLIRRANHAHLEQPLRHHVSDSRGNMLGQLVTTASLTYRRWQLHRSPRGPGAASRL